jgi:predicted dehydrogenase
MTSLSSTTKTTRIGIVGLGKMGLLHTATFNSLPGCEVVATMDSSSLPGEILSGLNPQLKPYPDLDSLLDQAGLNAVVIATPVAYHVPAALACVQRRIPFFMEKPLAATAEQSVPLIQALREKPLANMIGFMTRFVDSFARAKQILDSSCLGRLHRVSATMYVSQLFTRGEGWRYDRKIAGGGVLLSQGSHLLDLLTWYFGPVTRVNANVLPVYSSEVEDFAHVMLQFNSGLTAWLDASWSVRGKRTVQATIHVIGDQGELTVTDDTVSLVLNKAAAGYAAGRTVWNASDLYRGVDVEIAGPHYTREAQTFIEALRTGQMPQPDALQAYHVQQIVDAAYHSSDQAGSPQMIAS